MGTCSECGHSILSHRNGACLAIVTLPKVYRGEPTKAHCGCAHIQPPNSQGQQTTIDDLFPEITNRLKKTGRVMITSTPAGPSHGWLKKAFL